jgi:hypothetical protein
MTPKEKADNLCTRFIYRTTEYVSIDDAKKCALIAVDEIYKLTLNIGQHLEEFEDKANYYSYWEEVKQHIEQL